MVFVTGRKGVIACPEDSDVCKFFESTKLAFFHNLQYHPNPLNPKTP